MTTSAPGPARAPTPRPKAMSTAGANSESATAAAQRSTQPTASPASTIAPRPSPAGARRSGRVGAPDPLSDRSTAFLIRRILCPQHDKGRATPTPIEELLPPLTSRNDVDLQLYALLAIILREYVQNWYNKITPDETFVAEIVQIIAHCTRALEQRLRKVDLESLLFDELPDLLDKHITASRIASDAITQPPIQTNPHEVYHSLCPLPALSPVPKADDPSTTAKQAENEAAYRQLLVQGVLAVLLPTEDLENECLTAIVGQIFSELIIGNIVANRLSEPWLIWEGLTIASGVIRRRRAESSPGRSHQIPKGSGERRGLSLQRLFLSFLHWCFLVATGVRLLVTTVVTSSSLPPRTARRSVPHDDVTKHQAAEESLGAPQRIRTPSSPSMTPVVAFRCWSAVSNLLEVGVRMPWLCGTLSMLQWVAMTGPGRIANVDGVVDR
ncbi:hypothetical protein GQ53DRAFT_642156 [Thozetella sp. PMI_491]|nr:hypothetical protein GQ53DRAFT_642156 [Thozetella sp. PMI_491]